ncbi:MAG: hypothetical protein Ta2B_00560 [Termitinemataceae bacterium]|nr:MAG: hypothetical protein Ta2B_00560 [Termitinemataceae bacterium]
MSDDICPSIFRLLISRKIDREHEDDISDSFEILSAKKLTQVKKFTTNSDVKLFIRLLCCHHVKSNDRNYCDTIRKNNKALKIVCKMEEKPRWTHFYMYPENVPEVEGSGYILSFIENAYFNENIENIINEQCNMINWLALDKEKVYLYLFTYGEPVYETRSFEQTERTITASINKNKTKIKTSVFPVRSKISKSTKEQLTISLKEKRLSFSAS